MFHVLLFLMILPSVLCQVSMYVCNRDSTYVAGSTYSINLDAVINDLSRNAPQSSGFNRSSSGVYPNKVYGLLQCFGPVSAAKCSDCSRQAYIISLRYCANNTGVRVLVVDCFLRYDYFDFSSTSDTLVYFLRGLGNITQNVQGFISTTSSLLSNLSNQAYIPANKLFSVGSANLAFTSDKVYGLVQCWTDSSIEECMKCLIRVRQQLEECCSSSKGARAASGNCAVRYEMYQFFHFEEPSPSPSPSPSAEASSLHRTTSAPSFLPVAHAPAKVTSQANSSRKFSKTLPLVLGLVGAFVGIMVLLVCCIVMRKRLKSAISGGPATLPTHNEEGYGFSLEFELIQHEQYVTFSMEELAEATDNFREDKKLGKGGFGVVYKGRTKDGKEIAVKKLSAKSTVTQVNKEFKNEVQLVATVQHRNLVKLLGCCAEGGERLIVYEYLLNKSLDTFLFDPEKSRLLDWQKRNDIIIGIARGLFYLHEDSRLKIIHRDIKPSNILLDDKFNPKIAAFGLARLFPELEAHIQTTVAGTLGYMAPEYVLKKKLSVKADVYSFGVLLLEIVSGKKSMDISQGMEITLVEWAWALYNGGSIVDMMDSSVIEACAEEQVLRFIHVGLLCVQADATLRPTMSNVFIMIASSSMPLPIPKEPGFLTSSKGFASNSRSKSSSRSGEHEKSTASQTSGTTTSSTSGVSKMSPK